jgi:hypothetical protein
MHHNDDAFHDVSKFPHVAGPEIVLENLNRLGSQCRCFPAVFPGKVIQEIGRQRNDVFPAVTQRRDLERKDVEPVIQILAKIAELDFAFKIFIGGCDNTDIHLDGTVSPNRRKALLLQNSKHLGLGLRTHVANLVQEKRAVIGLGEFPFFVFRSACEGTLHMTE